MHLVSGNLENTITIIRLVTTHTRMSVEEEQQPIDEPISDIEKVIEREIRVDKALFMLISTNYTWCQRPITILQNKLRSLGLEWTVFEEDPILFCTLKQRLYGKFRRKLGKYQPLLSLIKQRHWPCQVKRVSR